MTTLTLRRSAEGTEACTIRERMWMLCNLDDNLLLSRFHSTAEEERPAAAVVPGAKRPYPTSEHPHLPSGVTGAFTPTTTARVARHAGAGTADDPRAPASPAWAGDGPRLEAHGQPSPPESRPQRSVLPTRRDERITFHVRPTCHDFLGGWAKGRTAGTTSVEVSVEVEATRHENRSEHCSADEAAGKSGISGGEVVGSGAEEASASEKGHAVDGSTAQTKGSAGKRVNRVLAVGFKSGECAVLDATNWREPSISSVLNSGGRCCEGWVTAVRFVPREGRRLVLAAFSTGCVYTFDTTLAEEAPLETHTSSTQDVGLGAGATSASASTRGATSSSSSSHSNGSARSGHKRALHSKGTAGGSAGNPRGGSGGSVGSSGGIPIGRSARASGLHSGSEGSSAFHPSSSAESARHGATATSGGDSERNGRCAERRRTGFVVTPNDKAGVNPLVRWRVAPDGRKLTEMLFAPCEVEGRRLVAIAALDGVSRSGTATENVCMSSNL